jgi:hypothetical protein
MPSPLGGSQHSQTGPGSGAAKFRWHPQPGTWHTHSLARTRSRSRSGTQPRVQRLPVPRNISQLVKTGKQQNGLQFACVTCSPSIWELSANPTGVERRPSRAVPHGAVDRASGRAGQPGVALSASSLRRAARDRDHGASPRFRGHTGELWLGHGAPSALDDARATWPPATAAPSCPRRAARNSTASSTAAS